MEVIVRNNQRLIKISYERITRLLQQVLKQLARKGDVGLLSSLPPLSTIELSVLLVNDRQMRELNLAYRGIDHATDVLSFPQLGEYPELRKKKGRLRKPGFGNLLPSTVMIGDIIINLHQAKRQAHEYGSTLYEEVNRLLIHGLLHLFGYDHERNSYQAKKMRQMEKSLLEGIDAAEKMG